MRLLPSSRWSLFCRHCWFSPPAQLYTIPVASILCQYQCLYAYFIFVQQNDDRISPCVIERELQKREQWRRRKKRGREGKVPCFYKSPLGMEVSMNGRKGEREGKCL